MGVVVNLSKFIGLPIGLGKRLGIALKDLGIKFWLNLEPMNE
jgi:hypothetical protein